MVFQRGLFTPSNNIKGSKHRYYKEKPVNTMTRRYKNV